MSRFSTPRRDRANPPPITHEAIAERARQLWQRKGGPQGQDDQIWREAEGELLRDRIIIEDYRRNGKPVLPGRDTEHPKAEPDGRSRTADPADG